MDATIRRLRRALNAGGEADLLRTVRAEGYSLDHKLAAMPPDGDRGPCRRAGPPSGLSRRA